MDGEGAGGMRAAMSSYLEYLGRLRRLSAHTVRAYGTDLEAFALWCEREGIDALGLTRTQMRSYMAYLVRSGYTDKTVNRHLSALRSFFGWMEEHERVSTNAAASIAGRKQSRRLPVTISTEDVESLLATCDTGTDEGLRDRALLELLYASGARISEVANLEPSDIDFAQQQVTLFGKGSKERIVPLYPGILDLLSSYLKTARPALAGRCKSADMPTKLFVSTRGNDMSADALRARFALHARQAGLPRGVSPHAMRHTFATDVLSGGADLKAVQELLGHESLSTTQIYTHVSIEALRQATRQAHPRG